MRLRLITLGCLAIPAAIAACGADASQAGDPDGPDRGTADGGADDSAPGDAAAVDDALPAADGAQADGGSSTDGAATTTGSTPPAGSALCGSGTFTPADSTSLCQTSMPYTPPSLNVTKACGGGGVTFASGLWEAWCTPEGTYLFARFDGVTGFGVSAPGGMYESGAASGSANAVSDDMQRIRVSSSTTKVLTKAGKLHLLRYDGNTAGVTSFTMLGSVALTW